jgi:hypothetical protein
MFKFVLALSIFAGLSFFIYDIVRSKSVTFLDADDTASFLYEDSDGYVSNMTYLDILARHCKSHQEYLKKARDSALSFTEEQKQLLESCIQDAQYYLANVKDKHIQNKLFETLPWKIAYVDNTYENGLPHTRQDIIFLSIDSMKQSKQGITKTLIHEFIHIYQRTYSNIFRQSLLKDGYEVWRKRRGYPRVRANPDLDPYIYIHPEGHIMVSIYDSEKPSSITDVINPQDYEHEHPNEEIAHAIANAYLKRSL